MTTRWRLTASAPRGSSPAAVRLLYQPRLDLAGGLRVVMRVFDKAGGAAMLLSLSFGRRPRNVGPGTIERVISADRVIPPTAALGTG